MNRNELMSRLKAATQCSEGVGKTLLPEWKDEQLHTLNHPGPLDLEKSWRLFCERFKAVNGLPLEGREAVVTLLQEQSCTSGYLCPSLSDVFEEILGAASIALESSLDISQIDAIQFGITRASGIIAETGTLILKESDTTSRLAALAPWIHIAVVDNNTAHYADPLEAIEAFDSDPYIIFVTGPSKTADVEGILIEGVHGPGIQIGLKIE